MKYKALIIVPSLLMVFGQLAMANNTTKLTHEQLRHEKELSELRKQKEILEIKHSQALLIRDCQEMGIDCQSGDIKPLDGGTDIDAEIPGFDEPKPTEFSSPSVIPFGNTQSSTPKLEAIQNSSARLISSGASEWAMVGDTVGNWEVTYIDATKVRLKHASTGKTKTLILNW